MRARSPLLLSVLWLACGGDPPLTPGAVAARVSAVHLAIDLPARRAATTLSLLAPDAGCVSLASPPPLEVRWGTAPTTRYTHRDGGLTVCQAPAGPAELTVSAALDAPLAPATDQGLATRQGAVGRFTSMIAWVSGCGRLVACDPATALRTPVSFAVTHGADETVLCPGEVSRSPGHTTCRLDTPAPSYSGFTLVAATGWAETLLASTDAGTVTLFDAPGGAVARALAPGGVARALDWYTATLGPLPYGPHLTVAVGPLTWLGFEGPGLILLSEALPTLPLPWTDPALHAFAHELGHQWAGNQVTLRTPADFALKEALAEYLAFRFEEATAPAQAEATRLGWQRDGRFPITYPRPTGALPELVVLATGAVSVGPMMLLQLRPFLGAAALDAAVLEVLATPGAIGWEQLQAALERQGGQPLDAYFGRWVRGDGEPTWPTLEARALAADGGWALEVRQGGVPAPFPMQLELEVALEGGGTARLTAGFPLQATPPAVRVPVPARPASWVLDPDRRVLWWPAPAPLAPERPGVVL